MKHLFFPIAIICIAMSARASVLPDNFAHLPDDVQAVLLEYAFFSEQVSQQWGEQASFSSQKAYVKYLDDYLSRSRVDFESGIVQVETLANSEPLKQLKSAIVTTLLTPNDPNGVDIYSASKVKGEGKPFLLGQVLDHQGQAIAYEWRAKQYADYLIATRLQVAKTQQGKKFWVRMELVDDHNQVAANNVKHWVQTYSDQFNLPESLILGIIETESSFNPFAVSHANAYGLMQIIPSTAGRDVFEKVLKKTGQPSRQYLFNSQNNILVGSAYLKILRDRYLSKIHHPTSQLYCIISAYNSGAGNVFKTFADSPRRAIEAINQLSPDAVLWKLRKHQPSLEARRYIEKVLAHQKKYS